jgi:hypothetical protein
MCSDADHLQIICDKGQQTQVEHVATATRELADALGWMLDVAEARNCDPSAHRDAEMCAAHAHDVAGKGAARFGACGQGARPSR